MNEFKPSESVSAILHEIENAGFSAFFVGGCVRDMLLGRLPSDWDIASSALPNDIMRIFPKAIPTGLKYGTVTVITDNGQAEVTTFRNEASYNDCRRPSAVSFCGNIASDLSRRDFTINAMAYNPKIGIVDPYGGQNDLSDKIIRAVGDPDQRFKEDALRILRAFRFAAQLHFTIAPETYIAAEKSASLVSKISGERTCSELDRILLSDRPEILQDVVSIGALEHLGIRKFMCKSKKWNCIKKTPFERSVRWTAFFYLLKNHNEEKIMGNLHVDKVTKNAVLTLLSELEKPLPTDLIGIKKRLSTGLSPDFYRVFLHLYSTLKEIDTTETKCGLEEIVSRNEAYSLEMLAVNGRDLLDCGIAPGPKCGQILCSLLDMVISHPSINNKNALLDIVKRSLI